MEQTQRDLFDNRTPYGGNAGHKGRRTSLDAARLIGPKLNQLHRRVLKAYRDQGPMTADECAAHLDRSILTIRPRVAELAGIACLRDAGVRRKTWSMRPQIVWAYVRENPI